MGRHGLVQNIPGVPVSQFKRGYLSGQRLQISVNYPMNKFRGLSLFPNRTADCIQRYSERDNRPVDRAARSEMAQHFYMARPLVAKTRMLLKSKPLLPSRRECLSYIPILTQQEKTGNGDPTTQAPD